MLNLKKVSPFLNIYAKHACNSSTFVYSLYINNKTNKEKKMNIIQNPNDFSPFKFQVIIECGEKTETVEMVQENELKKTDKIISKKQNRFKHLGCIYTVERKIKAYKQINFRKLWQAKKFVKENA